VVDSPDIALIVPADVDRLHLVEQYRYPVAGRRWELPAGSADQPLDVEAAVALGRCGVHVAAPAREDVARLNGQRAGPFA